MNKFEIDNYVVQSNDLIASKWKLDRISLKLFEMAVAALDTSKENPSREVVLKKSDIFMMFHATDEGRYFRFKEHIKDLMRQVVEVDLPNNRVAAIVPITYSRWSKGDSDQRVILRFNEELMPMLIDLKTKFTSYSIANLVNLTSKYAIIIYKLAKMESWKGHTCTFSMETLREVTDTIDLYSRFEAFERKVLTVAVEEINNGRTDLVMKYEKVKDGRRVEAIRFYTRPRLSHADTDYDNPKPIKGLTDEDVTMSFDDLGWK